jgi:membrane protein DedA with SNARE-associated domain/rhodanese-related sulfurtransferase
MNSLGVAEVVHFVEHDGYALLFLWVLAEQGALPIPSIPLLIAVGAVIRAGGLSAVPALACCLAGALIADTIWFLLGRHRGKSVLRFFCRISLEPDSCVRRTENAFVKHGLKTLLVAKFVPGLNAVAAPLAGDSGIRVGEFLAFDSLGVVIWSGSFMGAGYLFSGQLELLLNRIEQTGSGFLILVFGLFAAWIAWKFIQRRRFLNQIDGDRITPEELRDRMDAGEDFYIVDLRGSSKGDGSDNDPSSVPGAIRISARELAANANQVPRDREVILYCNCPNDASSAHVALLLKTKGVTNVRPLLGGADAWEKMMQSQSERKGCGAYNYDV